LVTTSVYIQNNYIEKMETMMKTNNDFKMTLIPPSECSEAADLEIRVAVFNDSATKQNAVFFIYVDEFDQTGLVSNCKIESDPHKWAFHNFKWKTTGKAGLHIVYAKVIINGKTSVKSCPVNVIKSGTRTLEKISGAWVGINHWCEKESKYWKDEIKEMTDEDWRQIVRGMNEIDMNTIVIQEVFRNQEYVGKHNIEKNGYKGIPFYPSKLYPGKMNIAAVDPIEAILDEADKTGSYVLPGVGLYAWFDYTEGSLEWHKKIAEELWDMYGHHKSFYGWYVSEEGPGDLGGSDTRRQEIVHFFKELKAFTRKLCPDKPVMLAPNCYHVPAGGEYWPKLLKNVDILCPFAFHRMPEDDISPKESANLLQKLCDDAGCHMWLDMEVFLFENGVSLYPRPIEQIIEDMKMLPNFEKILCYQYPGLMNAPWARKKPGGIRTVKLFNDYKSFLKKDHSDKVLA